MTTAAALVADLRARGVALETRGDKLVIRPTRLVTPEELEELRQRKAEVLALLARPAPTAPAWTPPALHPATVAEVLGPEPDPAELLAVQHDVAAAVAGLRFEMQSGRVRPWLRVVRGRPLADWLPLETVARLLGEWEGRP
jgi:hypothetical protein